MEIPSGTILRARTNLFTWKVLPHGISTRGKVAIEGDVLLVVFPHFVISGVGVYTVCLYEGSLSCILRRHIEHEGMFDLDVP
jgi:hypothetical protein